MIAPEHQPAEPVTFETPRPVARAVMLQRWAALTYVHWPYPPAEIQRLLPDGLVVDTFDGAGWVGLVPFVMRRLRLPVGPAVPWLSTFVEVNVRTYVVEPSGRRAVYFFSLDVPRLGAAVVARAAYGLPYNWAGASFAVDGSRLCYSTVRRWPGPRGARASLHVELGVPIAPGDTTELEAFLTDRWGLSTWWRGSLYHAAVEHRRWPLQRGRLLSLDEDLVEAAGLPAPTGDPSVLVSPGVDVRVGRPQRVGVRCPTPGSR